MSYLDEALARFQLADVEYAGGLANHGPMAAEALAALGHASLIPGLVDVYAPRLPVLVRGRPLPAAERGLALGCPARLPDWVATFEREVEERPWAEVLTAWAPRLLPGLFSGATHGLLRTAHAVRGLSAEETPPRRRELAMGLAYWAGRYQPLPGEPGRSARPGCGPAELLAKSDPVPPPRRARGFFFDAVRVLDDDPGFVRAIESFEFDPAASLSQVLHELCRAAAELYLANPHARIAYVHCVTAPSALRLLAPYLDEETAVRAVGYAVQAALALHVVSAGRDAAGPDAAVERLACDEAEIRYRAACSLEEHAVKFAEACLREHAIEPAPVFLLAAADAAIHLDTGAGRGAC